MPIASFVEERLELGIDYGALGGGGFETFIHQTDSGKESRNVNRAVERFRCEIGERVLNKSELDYLRGFHRRRRGRAQGFRFKDWQDFKVTGSAGVLILISGNQYQLNKRESGTGDAYDRPIRRPVNPITVNGGGTYSVDYATGIVTHTAGPAPSGWTGDFDVPVRFDSDQFNARFEAYRTSDGEGLWFLASLPVIEDLNA